MRVLWVSVVVCGLGMAVGARGQATRGASAGRASSKGATQAVVEVLPAGAIDLGVKHVGIEIYGWEESDRKFTPGPGLVSGNGSMRDQRLSGRNGSAVL